VSEGETNIHFRLTPSTRRTLAAALAAALTALGGRALAEVGLSASVVSDYRYRGLSLSDERAAASVSVSYDHPSGLYAGVRLIGAKSPGRETALMGRMHYAGFAVRRNARVSIDAGVLNYNLTSYRGRKRTVDYNELYAGVVGEHFNAHLYYAPDYYQAHLRTLYADLGASLRPAPALRVFGHLGALAPVGGRVFPQSRKVRYDLKAGAALDIGQAELNLSWTRLTPPFAPRALGGPRAERLEVGAAYFF